MIARVRKAASRVVPERKASPEGTGQPGGYRRLLRWAALPVTDRRWAAPLSAVALGFGLFVGVAIGPGAAGTFATGAAQIIEIPGLVASAGSGEEGEGGDDLQTASTGATGSGGGEGSAVTEPATVSFASGESEIEPVKELPPKIPGPPSEPEDPGPEEQTLTGTVVHVNPAAGSYTLAEPGGTLDVVHAGKAPKPGAKLSVSTRLLANGTFAEAGARTKSGTRDRAKFTGIVTYVDPTPAAPAYSVSKRGVSVLVHVHPDPSGATPALPAVGAFATVAVDIEKALPSPPSEAETTPATPSEPVPTPPASPVEPAPPACSPDPSQPPPLAIQPSAILWQRQVIAPGPPFPSSDFSGIVEAVCADTGKLLISADDIRESGHDLLFTVKPPIDTTKLEIGQSVAAFATIGADGSLELTGLASDERTKGADDKVSTQGDLVPAKPQ